MIQTDASEWKAMRDQRRVVLIVDDDKDDLFLFERALKHESVGLTVKTVNSGTKAIAYLNGEGEYADRQKFPFPSVVFTDLKMGEVSGFDVVRFVKSNPLWSIVPLVVFSGSCDTDDIKQAYLAGASAYNCKPSTVQEREHLARVLLEYWSVTEVPEIDDAGTVRYTNSHGKIGKIRAD